MSRGSYSKLAAAEISSRIQTAIDTLRHKGETGRNIEAIIQKALRDYIPHAFGIETGFVRSLEAPAWQSRQIDILFTRQDVCHPLAVFPDTKVFPIESIVGFMEVTKTIDRAKLTKDFKKVADLKHKVRRHFRMPTATARQFGLLRDSPPPQSEKEVLRERITRIVIELNDLEPRFFYFAFTSKWKNIESICQNLASVGRELGVHLHGMMILDRGYFKHTPTDDPQTAYRISYLTDPNQAYIMFIHDIIDSLQTFDQVPSSAAIPLDLYNLVKADYHEYRDGGDGGT